MRILLLGGGTGGHFYPLIAVAHALRDVAEEQRILDINLTLIGDEPFDQNALHEEDIVFERIPTGKLRRYFSLLNISDSLKTIRGIFAAIWKFTVQPPDVVFSKGGYDAFPALVAARLYRIPVMIHESDSVPGKVNAWAGKFARRIAVSFPEAMKAFPAEKTALTGNPIRAGLLGGSQDEAFDMFQLESGIPTILILGGSQGAQKINDVVIAMLPDIIDKVQIIHSAGKGNAESLQREAEVILGENIHKKRYHVFPFLSLSQLRNASFISHAVVSRASSTIFEIAAWNLPAILIPLTGAAQDHQRENAYNYARIGAAEVVEEANLTPHLLIAEIMRIVNEPERREHMKHAARAFSRIDAARKIAEELIRLGTHE